MRIAQISTLAGPVNRERGGSIEQLVWCLSHELTRLGHDVTVFGAAGSDPSGEFVATLPGPYGINGAPDDWQVCEWINLSCAVAQSRRFDVLHSHAYLWGLPLDKLSASPVIHTTHVMPEPDTARLWTMMPQALVTGISRYQWSGYPELSPLGVVHHGVQPAEFNFCPKAEDYVLFLGRFMTGKGAELAIEAARTLELRLLLAGPRNDYYRRHIEPMVDGKTIDYVGWVAGEKRAKLLGGARALLYPLREPEPFGLVMLEAIMCGTPVAATRIGAVGEIIDEGVTGYSTEDVTDYVKAVSLALTLDRFAVRARAEKRFSAERMAREYAQVYENVVANAQQGRPTIVGAPL